MEQTSVRSNKELLEIMLSNQQLFKRGLCAWVFNLYINSRINRDELDILRNLIKKYPPKKWYSLMHYWKAGNIKPRIRWINQRLQDEKDFIKMENI